MTKKYILLQKIEQLRDELNNLAASSRELTEINLLTKSVELDRLLNDYYKLEQSH